MENTVVNGPVLFFGDLHISTTFKGKHINYAEECFTNMLRIKEIVEKEKPSAVVFAGDLNGVNEVNIADRQFLMHELQWLRDLNSLTKGNVYSVKGNHDFGQFTDFDFFIGLGLIKNPRCLNYYGTNSSGDTTLQVRFHMVNYGYETRKLDKLAKSINPSASDVVLGHADYFVDGYSEWYSAKNGVELSKLDNFLGVDMVISGHIHVPSKDLVYATMNDGSEIGLFYVGSPSRVADRYDDCWYTRFEYIQESDVVDFSTELFGLSKAEEVFYDDDSYEYGEEEDFTVSQEQSDKLTELVKSIIDSRLAGGDIESQIKAVPGVSDKVKELAIRYLRYAEQQNE